MCCQIRLCILTSLTDLFSVVCIPCTTLIDQINLRRKIQDISFSGNSFSEHDIKFCFLERRCNFILHDLHADMVTNHLSALLQSLSSADIHTDR